MKLFIKAISVLTLVFIFTGCTQVMKDMGLGKLADLQYMGGGIHNAAARGDIEELKKEVQKQGAEKVINSRDSKLNTPLHFAAFKGKLETVKYLLSIGADINAVDVDNTTPLLSAALGNQIKTFSYLIGKGADLSIVRTDGLTPLMAAVYNGYIPTLSQKEIIQLNKNLKDDTGDSVYVYAATGINTNAVALLSDMASIVDMEIASKKLRMIKSNFEAKTAKDRRYGIDGKNKHTWTKEHQKVKDMVVDNLCSKVKTGDYRYSLKLTDYAINNKISIKDIKFYLNKKVTISIEGKNNYKGKIVVKDKKTNKILDYKRLVFKKPLTRKRYRLGKLIKIEAEDIQFINIDRIRSNCTNMRRFL